MRILIPALAAASVLMLSLPSYAAENVQAGGKTTDVQGRAIDDVKAGGKTTDVQGRAVDDVKAGGKTTDVQGRALDKKTTTKKKKAAPKVEPTK